MGGGLCWGWGEMERSNEPEALEVRAGLFGRTRLLISVDDITEVDPQRGVLTLADPARSE
jgi:hypothetical protein